MTVKDLTAYEIIREQELAGIASRGTLLRHKKSGARVLLVENEDENKVFNIGFRTPPQDSTGVPHIMEHSVLCGSRKYPTKDPFVELVKGSLNTFLNAMTYPDKTVYPVASLNDQDFQNLMEVYLDAVFYPNIYEHEEIFRQEGWSYKLDSPEAELQYNGVVYNEMKGAFSSPESVLDRLILNKLFPQTPYANESGGDPDVIPQLSYEQFLEFHRTYYHPSNSYIYLYGKMDMAAKLRFIDEEYLSRFTRREMDSRISLQPPFAAPVDYEAAYGITSEESETDNTYLSYNTVVGSVLDQNLYLAFKLLDYVLLSSNGAVLKKALIAAGIGSDILGGYDNSVQQPMFSVVAKGANVEQKQQFLTVIRETLDRLVTQGLDRRSLEAALNYYEFRFREADFGGTPTGLMYGLQIFDSWLYDEDQPFLHIDALPTFDYLRSRLDDGYFEELIRTYLLDNPHTAVITLKPERGRTTRRDQELAARLQAYKDSLSPSEIDRLVTRTKALADYQAAPDAEADVQKIPLLKITDIRREIEPLANEEQTLAGLPVVFHDYETNGIGYVTLYFSVRDIAAERLPYLGLLQAVLGLMDTQDHTYGDFSDEINIHTGGIGTDINVYQDLATYESGAFTATFEIKAKALYDKIPVAFAMIREMLTATKLADTKRIKELLAMSVSRLLTGFQASGHTVAVARAQSYRARQAKYKELIGGIDYYQTLVRLQEHFDSEKDDIVANLRFLQNHIFRAENLSVSYTARPVGLAALTTGLERFKAALYTAPTAPQPLVLTLTPANEGFMTASKVQYVAQTGSFAGRAEFTGALNILKVMLSYDYLWQNIRVQGGAYGCMSGFGRFGEGYFVTYRDPHLKRSLAVFRGIVDYLRNFEASPRELTKFIIGTISNLDHPLNAPGKGDRSMALYQLGVTPERLQRERDQVLDATVADIRALADIVQAILDGDQICVVGGEDKIEEDRDCLDKLTRF